MDTDEHYPVHEDPQNDKVHARANQPNTILQNQLALLNLPRDTPMSTIYKRRGVWYYDTYVDSRRVRRSLRTGDKKTAAQRQRALEKRIWERQIGAPVSHIRLPDFITVRINELERALQTTHPVTTHTKQDSETVIDEIYETIFF